MNKRMTLAAALLAAVTGSAAYAQPANDLICNATDISTQVGSVDFATTDATLATEDADTTCNSGTGTQTQKFGVWWRFNSPTRTNIRVFEPAANDVVIAVFSGADCNTATQVTLPANACSDSQDVIFTAEPNTNYWIVVGMFSNTATPTVGGYATTIATFPIEANDVCSGAIDVTSSLPYSGSLDQRSFTTDVDVTCNSGTIGTAHGQWFTFTAPAAGLFRINETSGIDAVMQAYAACGGSLVGTCVDFAPETISINTTMGTQYWILIGRFSAPSSPAFFQQSTFSNPTTANYTVTATFSLAPPNDTACTATPIASLPFSENIDAAAAAFDADLGTCNSSTLSTWAGVWYTYTTGANPENLTITEAGTTDAVYALYTGACASPTAVAGTCIDDSSTVDTATYRLNASTQYYILVGNFSSAIPSTNYDLSFISSPVAANDLVCNATDLNAQSFPFVDTVDNRGGTDDADPSCNSSVTSGWTGVWYEYLSGATTELLTVSESGLADVNLSLWTGTLACPAGTGLTQVAAPAGCTDTDASGAFTLTPSTQYYIQVAHSPSSIPGAAYATTFNIVGVPANDTCASAAPVASLPFGPTTIDARLAAAEGDVSCNTHTSAIASVWYAFTPASNQTIICNETSSQDVVWTVFTSCGGAEFGCSQNDNTTFALLGDGLTTYYIQLAMQSSTLPTGAFTFTIANPSAANDSVCNATNLNTAGLPGSSFSESVDTTALTDEAATATCDGPTTARQGVWYVYTTGATRETLAITETGSPDTINAVFTGTPVCPAGTGLTQIFCADAGTTDNGNWTLNANTTYYILISYFFSTGFPAGNYEVGFTSTPLTPPANDTCATAEVLSLPASLTVDIRGALDDADVTCNDAANSSLRHAIWYSLNVMDSGTLFFNETSSNDVDFVIYEAASPAGCGSLPAPVYCSTTEPSSFAVTGGTDYIIEVGLHSATTVPTVDLALTFEVIFPPDNDDCESAEPWSIGGGSVSPDGRVAGNDPDVTCNTGTATSSFAGVWYSFSSPDDNGRLRISETSANDVVIVVFEGAACGALTQVTCSDPEANIDTPVTAGTNYFVMVARFAASAPTAPYAITYSFLPNTGACCQSGGVCTSISNSACDAISGAVYQGDGVSCTGAFIGGTEYSSTEVFPATIPDALSSGVSRTLTIAGSGVTIDSDGIAVKVGLTHSWVGDLIGTISNGTVTADLFRRIGDTTGTGVGDSSNLLGDHLFYDGAPSFTIAAAAGDTAFVIPAGPYAASGAIGAVVSLGAAFTGQPLDGTWTLFVSDNAGSDTGTITSFSVREATYSAGPCPTGPTPCEIADFDNMNGVDVVDLFAFLDAWFAETGVCVSNCSSDISLPTGSPDVTDLFDYLDLWFFWQGTNPCP